MARDSGPGSSPILTVTNSRPLQPVSSVPRSSVSSVASLAENQSAHTSRLPGRLDGLRTESSRNALCCAVAWCGLWFCPFHSLHGTRGAGHSEHGPGRSSCLYLSHSKWLIRLRRHRPTGHRDSGTHDCCLSNAAAKSKKSLTAGLNGCSYAFLAFHSRTGAWRVVMHYLTRIV